MTLPVPIVPRPSIELAHHRIHEGNHFMVHKMYINIPTATKYFLVIPPPVPANPNDTVEMHLIFEITTEPGGTLELFEDSTVTINGALLDINNNNRRSSTSSLAFVYDGPTFTSLGKPIFEGASAISGGEIGETNRNDEEFVLHPAKKYIFKFDPYPVVPPIPLMTLTFELEWYDNRPSTSFI